MDNLHKHSGEKRISIAILDDEENILQRVEQVIHSSLVQTGYQVDISCYNSVHTLKWDIEEKKKIFDIFVLDIEIGEDNGLEVAKYIRSKDQTAYLIFMTSYMEYSIEAYECETYRYILKKQMDDKLVPAILNLCEKIESKEQNFYVIENQYYAEKIMEHDILYLYKESKYTYFVLQDGTKRVRKSLSNVKKELRMNLFAAIDKSIVVNLEHVMSLDNREITMRNGDKLICCQTKIHSFKENIRRYWGI